MQVARALRLRRAADADRPAHACPATPTRRTARRFAAALAGMALAGVLVVAAHAAEVVDIRTREGVTQRVLVLDAPSPRAAAILFAGGNGGLQLRDDGRWRWGGGNFLVRTREQFAALGVTVAILDAPSDRPGPQFLEGFRQTTAHAADVRATIRWLRERTRLPVWLVGTSRGTESAAFAATELVDGEGPDGVVLTSSILQDRRGRPVQAMPLDRLRVPVLVVHHAQDGCRACPFAATGELMARLAHLKRHELLAIEGGISTGDPCGAFAHHGYNGREREVVESIVAWMLAR